MTFPTFWCPNLKKEKKKKQTLPMFDDPYLSGEYWNLVKNLEKITYFLFVAAILTWDAFGFWAVGASLFWFGLLRMSYWVLPILNGLDECLGSLFSNRIYAFADYCFFWFYSSNFFSLFCLFFNFYLCFLLWQRGFPGMVLGLLGYTSCYMQRYDKKLQIEWFSTLYMFIFLYFFCYIFILNAQFFT